MTSHSEKPSRAPAALVEDEVAVLPQVCRDSDVSAREIACDATPEAIADDEPTVPINLRRAGRHVPHPVQLDNTRSSD
jgi:hypothetical protein